MKIVFFGTPDYVLPILNLVHKKYVSKSGESPIVAVVTASPKPIGRKQFLEYSAVDKWAHDRNIPVFYSSKDWVGSAQGADVGVLAAYSEIIPEFVISNLKFGILNVHPSPLPKYRGASPVQAAILNGDSETGVTIIKIDKLVDHGPAISQFKEKVLPSDTTETLRARLFERSAVVLTALIAPYLQGKIKLKEQNHKMATYTKIIKKEDGFIDPKKDSPEKIEKKLRAYTPWPGIWTLIEGKRLKILKAHIDPDTGHLTLDTIQLEGKNPVSWKQFKEAYPNSEF